MSSSNKPWFVFVSGPADTSPERLLEHLDAFAKGEAAEAISSAGSCAGAAMAWFARRGFPCTEKEVGFGEWTVGVAVSHEDAHRLFTAFLADFAKAREANLIRGFVWPIRSYRAEDT